MGKNFRHSFYEFNRVYTCENLIDMRLLIEANSIIKDELITVH